MINGNLYFDCDCLSAFLWVNEESLLYSLYPNRVIIPKPVYVELSNPKVPHLKTAMDTLIANSCAKTEDLLVGSAEYSLYNQMVFAAKPIGRGEAAAIALAKCKNGVLASNNLKDVAAYVSNLGLQSTTTSGILVEAFKGGMINETRGNAIWANMLRKRRRLGAPTFSDYLAKIKTT